MNKPKKIAIMLVAGIFMYLSIFTWNLRTGHLDALSSYTGLDISGLIIRPGLWVGDKVVGFWERYVYLVGLKEQNDNLREEAARLTRENMLLSARARSAQRLEKLMGYVPPEAWDYSGAHVVTHRMGPAGILSTLAIDRGASTGVESDMPVLSLDGVAGRILDVGAMNSSVLLISDPNSRVAVLGAANRSPGMLSGQGYDKPLKMRFVNLNAVIEPGELLVTSGLSGIFPKELPVARVTKVQRSDISLFLSVEAEPLVDVASLEEVLLLNRLPAAAEPVGEATEPEGEERAATR